MLASVGCYTLTLLKLIKNMTESYILGGIVVIMLILMAIFIKIAERNEIEKRKEENKEE